MLFQNLAGQKLPLYVTDADGYPLAGIAAQLTAYVSVNGGTPQSAGTVTEVGGGHYYISPTQAQTNGHLIQWWATSSLTGIKIAGGAAFTTKLAIPAVQAGTNGGLPTVDSSNYVAGVQNLSSIVASAILSNPSYKLNTNSSGYVTVASNLDKNGYALTSAYDRAKDALKYTEYTAPDNTSIAAIKTKTDQLNFDTGKVLAKVSDPVTISSTDVSAIVDGVWDEPISQHTTSGTTGAALNNAGSGSVDTGAIAQAVWQYTTRELTGFSFQVTVGTNLDKTGYSLTSAYDRAKDALKYTEYTVPPTLQDIVQETAEAVLSSDITQLGTVPTYSLATIIYGSLNFEINGAYMYIKNGGNTTITTRAVEYDPNGYPIKAIKPQT